MPSDAIMPSHAVLGLAVLVGAAASMAPRPASGAEGRPDRSTTGEVRLPPPHTSGDVELEQAIARRRSVRDFAARALTTEQIGQLLWAAQGVTDRARGFRAAPSAGALYPLEVYVVDAAGVYRYAPDAHALALVRAHDQREPLARAAFDQAAVREAPVDLVIVAVVARTRARYGSRAERYVALEAGHAAENVLLEATALGLGAVPIGAFEDDEVRRIVEAPDGAVPLYVLPVGHPAR